MFAAIVVCHRMEGKESVLPDHVGIPLAYRLENLILGYVFLQGLHYGRVGAKRKVPEFKLVSSNQKLENVF